MTPSSSSLLRFVVDDFDIPICFFCSCICSTFLRLLSVQREAHCYPARMVAPEGSLWATCSTRARSRGSLARPYMLLLMSLSRFTCPSRGPWPPSAARVLQAPQPCLVGSLWQTTSTRARGSVQQK